MLTEEQLESALNKAVAFGYVSNAFGVAKLIKDAMSEPQPADIQEGIPLQIDLRWKWAAMDEDGIWYGYAESIPTIDDEEEQWFNPDRDCTKLSAVLAAPPQAPDWRDSLHEIRNGRLVKYVDIPADGEPVMVRTGSRKSKWVRRYSTGKTNEDNELICYDGGTTKWSSGGQGAAWNFFRRPTQEELNQ